MPAGSPHSARKAAVRANPRAGVMDGLPKGRASPEMRQARSTAREDQEQLWASQYWSIPWKRGSGGEAVTHSEPCAPGEARLV
jgi:hypothetical protein